MAGICSEQQLSWVCDETFCRTVLAFDSDVNSVCSLRKMNSGVYFSHLVVSVQRLVLGKHLSAVTHVKDEIK
jgi:hypothetical protein